MFYCRGLRFPQIAVVHLLLEGGAACTSLNGHSARKCAVLVSVWCCKCTGDREQSLWRYWSPEGCINKWYDKPKCYGCLCKECGPWLKWSSGFLYLVTWPSHPTYRVKTQDLKHHDSHHWPENPFTQQIPICFVYCFLYLWAFCQALLLLTYLFAIKIWSCYEVDPWHIIHILGFTIPKLLTYIPYDYGSFSIISSIDLCWSVYRQVLNWHRC